MVIQFLSVRFTYQKLFLSEGWTFFHHPRKMKQKQHAANKHDDNINTEYERTECVRKTYNGLHELMKEKVFEEEGSSRVLSTITENDSLYSPPGWVLNESLRILKGSRGGHLLAPSKV